MMAVKTGEVISDFDAVLFRPNSVSAKYAALKRAVDFRFSPVEVRLPNLQSFPLDIQAGLIEAIQVAVKKYER